MDAAFAVCPGPSNSVYVTGRAGGSGGAGKPPFPTLAAIQTNSDMLGTHTFVSRMDPDGQLLMSTYHGGSSEDHGLGIAAGPDETPRVVGYTRSTSDFPLTNAFQSAPGDGGSAGDAFVFRMPRLPLQRAPLTE